MKKLQAQGIENQRFEKLIKHRLCLHVSADKLGMLADSAVAERKQAELR